MELRDCVNGLDAGHSKQDVDCDAARGARVVLVVEGPALGVAQYAVAGTVLSGLRRRWCLDDLGAKAPLRGIGSGMGAKLARTRRDRGQGCMVLPRQAVLA